MRITHTLLFVAAVAGIAVIAPNSGAQNFPSAGTWQAITRGQAVIAATTGGNQFEDIVGDTTTAGAAAYVYSDASFLYFRIRLNADPVGSGAIRNDRVYGCEIDTDGDNAYEYLAAYDGVTNLVSVRQNSGTTSDSPADVSETATSSNAPGGYPTGTWGRVSVAATNTSGNPDYFVDIAVARPVVATNTLRFVCGTGSVTGTLNLQVFSPNDGTLTNTWSDPFVCGSTGCLLDRDSDGVPDSVEAGFGTDPLLKDSDNDGINDNVELSASGSTGPYSAIDTDGDGTKDALDTDSDNDCLPDNADPSYRVKVSNPSSACVGNPLLPVCSSATGACSACDGPNGGATPAACPTAQAPACNANGSCTQCKVGQTALCSNPTPACGTAGTCTLCNGDFGDGVATAVCPSGAAPACQKSGALNGRCLTCSATNTSLCTAPTAPSCDLTTGGCVACDGDFNGGRAKGCPSSTNPRCDFTTGECGKCTTNTDCGGNHAGPTCNTATGACYDTDSDGDGIFDSVELALGTDPTKTDTDGDGIPDSVELTPNGGGQFAKVDSDNDGTIDAKDTDSDNDGLLDSQEGTADTDGDGAANYRDPDDDGDKIPTKIEVEDTIAAKVLEDVDSDGSKNWLDKDSDGNGIEDGDEGRGDEDSDGIPDYLDAVKTVAKPDAGTSSSSSGGTTSSSSGFTSNDQDSGVVPDAGPPPEEGVVEGTGLFCGRASGSGSADLGVFVLGALAVMGAARRRRR